MGTTLATNDVGSRFTVPSFTITITNASGHPYSLDEDAFWDFRHLQSIVLPEGLTSIGENAFVSCSELSKVTIPKSVLTIGIYAFADCLELKEVVFLSKTPPDFTGYSHFRNQHSDCVFRVPNASYVSVLNNMGIALERIIVPERKVMKIKEINIKQGKVEIKPRK